MPYSTESHLLIFLFIFQNKYQTYKYERNTAGKSARPAHHLEELNKQEACKGTVGRYLSLLWSGDAAQIFFTLKEEENNLILTRPNIVEKMLPKSVNFPDVRSLSNSNKNEFPFYVWAQSTTVKILIILSFLHNSRIWNIGCAENRRQGLFHHVWALLQVQLCTTFCARAIKLISAVNTKHLTSVSNLKICFFGRHENFGAYTPLAGA